MIQRWLCVLAFLVLSIYSPVDCSAQDANTDAELKRVRALLQETSPKLAADFEKRLKQSQREVEQYKKGHVVFGQIQLEDSKDPRSVVSQMIVLENGFFVDAVGEAGKPIGFRMHGYESVTVIPKGPGLLENLGIIRLKPLPENRFASAKGRVTIEPHAEAPNPNKVVVNWQFPAEPINTPHNGTEGITPFYPDVQSKVGADGTFEVSRMSPGKYTLYVKAPNCVQLFRDIELVEGQADRTRSGSPGNREEDECRVRRVKRG